MAVSPKQWATSVAAEKSSSVRTVADAYNDRIRAARIRQALEQADLKTVGVVSHARLIQLNGSVRSREEKLRAEEIVRAMKGVQEIHNDIVIRPRRAAILRN